MTNRWNNEKEARQDILDSVIAYYHQFKEEKSEYVDGDRVPYAGRVYDEKEMCSLAEATLDFWLTSGRYVERFEKEFAEWLGVKYASLVKPHNINNVYITISTGEYNPSDNIITTGTHKKLTVSASESI